MDSTGPIQTLFKPFPLPTVSGMAAYSSENELAFLQMHTRAGFVAGVFFGRAEAPETGLVRLRAEALHRRGDAAVQRVPNSLAQTRDWFAPMNNPLGPSGPDGFPLCTW
jgi:hypothetical protein